MTDEVMGINDFLDRSIIVAAHPDDEALWFGSVLQRVDALVICYLDIPSNPLISEGRRRCMAKYPLRKARFLEIAESEASANVNWRRLKRIESGIHINRRKNGARRYNENYCILREVLRDHLRECRNVFTHNPWGEYGHAEHVQVYRAVKSLQEEMGYRIWCSNYCSNISFSLFMKYVLICSKEYVTLTVDQETTATLRNFYMRNDCWTWYNDWKWFHEECFIQDSWMYSERSESNARHLFPVNMIKMPESQGGNRLKKMARKVLEGNII